MADRGRKNVRGLVKGQIETPNDISGVVYVPLDEAGGWRGEAAKELKARGFEIKDPTRLPWLDADRGGT